MTPHEEQSARLFQSFHDRLPESERNVEYLMTFRLEGGNMVPNQTALVKGGRETVATPSGGLRDGTKVHIHSHPHSEQAVHAIPSNSDHRMAHRRRTNALNPPGTDVSNMMYDPFTRKFYGYTGDFDGNGAALRFFEKVFPQPSAPPAE